MTNISSNFKKLARTISIIENETAGFEDILRNLKNNPCRILGITGPPGAGKSTLTDNLIGEILKDGKKVGVICVDPSSPFHRGALLGDRIRMSRWYNHPDVFIRSLANKGTLGGLHPKIIEITDVMKDGGFDYIIIETVGVGQSEVDIAGLADITIVVLVPEGGDSVQLMKAGLLEVGDIFIVNKFDRPGASEYFKSLQQMIPPTSVKTRLPVPVLKIVATKNEGVSVLFNTIKHLKTNQSSVQLNTLVEKAWSLLQNKSMIRYNKAELKKILETAITDKDFNLYRFISAYSG